MMLYSFSGFSQSDATSHPFEYLSPLPSSTLHLPGAYIVIRDGNVDYQGGVSDENFILMGSESGDHEFEIHTSRDGKTINLVPKVPFDLGEEVEVSLVDLPKTVGTIDFDWLFEITPELIIPVAIETEVTAARSFSDITIISQAQAGHYDAPIFTQTKSATQGMSAYGLLNPDASGDPIFCSDGDSSPIGPDFKLNRNGLPTLWSNADDVFWMLDPDLQFERSFNMVGGYVVDEHDFQIMPNGNYFLFAYDPQPFNMAEVVEGGDPEAVVEGFVVQEFDYNDVLLLQWRSWDFLNVTDNENQTLTSGILTPFHVNALEIDTDGNVFLSSRHTNELTKYHRLTGEIIWRWTTNSYGDFEFTNDGGFSYQHDARRLENGNILLFDNANLSGQLSRAVEYSLDTVAWTATLVWEYSHPLQLFGSSRGGAQRLPNGNTMIAWGNVGSDDYGVRIQEVGPAGQNILEFAFELGHEGYRAPKHLYDPDNWVGGCGDLNAPNFNPNADYWLPEFCQDDLDGDGYSIEMGDCDEGDEDINPGAEEIANDGIDQDCDGEDLIVQKGDEDEDGFTVEQGDCNDNDDSINPDAEEIPYDGIDQDCDGEDLTDVDGDGYSPEDGDCNDDDSEIGPEIEEIPYDGIDQDCDGEDLTDVDGDGYSPEDGDCDDSNEDINPEAIEIPNDGIDQDCDGEDLIVGMAEQTVQSFSAWYNNDQLIVNWPTNDKAVLEVYDTAGRLIVQTDLTRGNNNLGAIGQQGMYILRVLSDHGSSTKRVFIN